MRNQQRMQHLYAQRRELREATKRASKSEGASLSAAANPAPRLRAAEHQLAAMRRRPA